MRRVLQIGRNDPCWCGSKKKFKHCHYGREEQPLIAPWKAEAEFRKSFANKVCSAPDQLHHQCKGGIVRAHTISRAAGLSKIVREGHVYSFDPSLAKLSKNNGQIVPELRGVKSASTFTGFCSFHDGEIFKPLEQSRFVGTAEQCFLLTYRAFSRECYTKRAMNSLLDKMKSMDSGKDQVGQMFHQITVQATELGAQAATKDNLWHKAKYDQVLLSGDYSKVRACIFYIDQLPQVMCSSGFNPTEDFEGNQLQNLFDLNNVPKMIGFSSIAVEDDRGAIVFSWLPDSDDVCVPFIESLNARLDDDLPNALIRFFFEATENIHMKPEWWETLDQNAKTALVRHMSGSASPFVLRPTNPLADDGFKYVEWKIEKRLRFGF